MSIGNDIRLDRGGLPQLPDREGARAEQPARSPASEHVRVSTPEQAAARVDRGESVLAVDPWADAGGARRLPAEPGFQSSLAAQPLGAALDAASHAIAAALDP
ncbi:MAG: hypothetical protein ACXIUZ_06035 [Lysobacteraceae bacterium]